MILSTLIVEMHVRGRISCPVSDRSIAWPIHLTVRPIAHIAIRSRPAPSQTQRKLSGKVGPRCRFRASSFDNQPEDAFPRNEGGAHVKFLSIYKTKETGTMPTPEEMARMGKLIEEGMKACYLLAVEGCLPSATGARVRLSNGQITVTDGPFAETAEVVGGLALIR